MPPRRRLDDVRRPQILAAAAELLTEEGLSDVRVADVAERAGTSATSVIYYFGTKADLSSRRSSRPTTPSTRSCSRT